MHLLVCLLCKNVFLNQGFRGIALAALLVHELVHACCGTELDCEVIEWLCFSGQGWTVPTLRDIDDAVKQSEPGSHNGEVRGRFFVWYNLEGYIKCKGSDQRFEPSEAGDPSGEYWGPRDLTGHPFSTVEPVLPAAPSGW